MKQSTTVRLDADVLAWLKAKGKGYQTRLNAILREAMMREVGLNSTMQAPILGSGARVH